MDEVELIYSDYCQSVTRDGKTIRLEIYSTGRNDWILEVVDEDNNSTVWDDTFGSDEAAYKEFQRVLEQEGIDSMIGIPQ